MAGSGALIAPLLDLPLEVVDSLVLGEAVPGRRELRLFDGVGRVVRGGRGRRNALLQRNEPREMRLADVGGQCSALNAVKLNFFVLVGRGMPVQRGRVLIHEVDNLLVLGVVSERPQLRRGVAPLRRDVVIWTRH